MTDLLQHLPSVCKCVFISKIRLDEISLQYIREIDDLKQPYELRLRQEQINSILPKIENITDLTIETEHSYLPSFIHLNCLARLKIIGNFHRKFNMQLIYSNLKYLKIESENVAAIDLSHFIYLKELELSYCPQLEKIEGIRNPTLMKKVKIYAAPKLDLTFIRDCTNLKDLDISYNGKGKKLVLDKLFYLKRLSICYTNYLPEYLSFRELINLESLTLKNIDCQVLPNFSALKQVEMIKIEDLNFLTTLPSLRNAKRLKSLSILCKNLNEIPNLDQNTQLEEISILKCHKITSIPSLQQIRELTSLIIKDCNKLENLSKVTHLTKLSTFILENCDSLNALPNFNLLPALFKLCVMFNSDIPGFVPQIDQLVHLRFLSLQNYEGLESFLNKTTQLEELHIKGSKYIKTNLNLTHVKSIQELKIENWNLETFPSINNLPNLARIIVLASRLQRIDSLDQLPNLESLIINDCPNLSSIQSITSRAVLKRAFPNLNILSLNKYFGKAKYRSRNS